MKKWLSTSAVLAMALCLFLFVPMIGSAQSINSPGVMKASSTIIGKGDIVVPAQAENYWVIECYDKYGNFKWREKIENLVVNNGLSALLSDAFKGATASSTWYIGLVGTTSTGFVATDTAATHSGWAEVTAYTLATRPALTLGTVTNGSVDNTGSVAPFTMNATTTVYGAFIADSNTKTTGYGTVGLYAEGAFTTSRSCQNGDILNITITLTVTASDAADFLFDYLNHFAMIEEPYEFLRPTA